MSTVKSKLQKAAHIRFGYEFAVKTGEPPRLDSLISWERSLAIQPEVLMESLILAQDERWRRA